MVRVALASKGGPVAVVVGVPVRDVTVPLSIVQDHQIRIQGGATCLPRDYAESIHLLRSPIKSIDIIGAITTSPTAGRRSLPPRPAPVLVSFDR